MKNLNQSISLWFSIIMVLLVVAGVFAFTFTDFMIDRVNGGRRLLMIIVFCAYAIFRGMRVYQQLTKREEE